MSNTSKPMIVKRVDKDIKVSGEHPPRTDRLGLGRISGKLENKYELPDNVEPDSIVSILTPNGVLTIEGSKKSGSNAEIVILITVFFELSSNY